MSQRERSQYVQVAVPAPLRRLFDYRWPAAWPAPQRGQRVRVPFGRQQLVGLVFGGSDHSDVAATKLKSVSERLDDVALVQETTLTLLEWAAAYYHHPVGEVMQQALPVLLRQGRPAEYVAEREWALTSEGAQQDPVALAKRAPVQANVLAKLRQGPARSDALEECGSSWRGALGALEKKGWLSWESKATLLSGAGQAGPALNPAQQQAVDAVLADIDGFARHLLFGITGSGKTEVYLSIIEQVLRQGRQVLVLVPEIGLTPQLAARFRQRLSGKLVVLHSGLNESERLNAWLAASRGEADVVLGTRSAVFVPMPRLGLIVVDEEHDASLKQQDGFRYHGRDVAVMRAHREKLPVVLGSATPSLESMQHALNGTYRLLPLEQRAGGAALPRVTVLDMRQSSAPDGLSPALTEALTARVRRGEQALVFLNRRGFAPVLMCYDCGWIAPCPRCDARMVWHKAISRLRCHHCGSEQATPAACPQCESGELHPVGEGTERLEDVLATRVPGARIARLDRDSTRRKGSLEAVLEKVHAGEVDILVGTQMLAKGHDFPNVTLVGVVNADSGLYSVDFRAPEHLFQQIMQVAGRAGRADKPGEVMVQTWHPQHPLFSALVQHDYEAWVRNELNERKQAQWPPCAHLALLRAEASSRDAALEFVRDARELGLSLASAELLMFEAVPAPMERRAGRYRTQLLVQSVSRSVLHRFLAPWLTHLEEHKASKKVRWSLDVDPVDLY